ncbi:MAG: methyl-accepting chemotaxis protein [Thiotrichaceae bacterium]|nr:methyl-accepting chemotaxis protein [Thiotrichaceae bacterium]
MKNLSIGKKLFILALFSMSAIIGVGVYSLENLRLAFTWVGDLYQTAQNFEKVDNEIGQPINRLRQLSLMMVVAPDVKMRTEINQQQQELGVQLEKNMSRWQNEHQEEVGQNAFNPLVAAWEQYHKAQLYTTQQILEGHREAAFINVSNAERQQFEQLIKQFNAWLDVHVKAAGRIHQESTQSYHHLLLLAVITFVILLLIMVLFNWYTARLITAPINDAVKIAKAITDGDFNSVVKTGCRDEVGQLLQALDEMQQQLRARIAEEKRIADEALRINQALDSVTTGVLIADNQNNIIYLNAAAKTMFRQEAEKIRKELPNFDPERLINHSVDVLHKNAQSHRELLRTLQDVKHGKLDLDALTIEYTVAPVINAHGERLGIVKELNNRTLEVATEQEINAVTHAASQGNLEQRLDLDGKRGFFRNISESLNQIMDLNQLALQDTMRVIGALAKGDLTQIITNEYRGAFLQLKNDTNSTVKKLTEVMALIQETSDAVSQAADELSAGNLSLSQRTEQQAAALEETAASIEEMTSTVQQNAESAKQANLLASNARQQAQEGGEIVNSAVSAMLAINESSQRVSDIVSVIDEIAFQTNLLALNAAVEAARAGEQGRGFAVVAAEVRNLAQRSAAAAKEIKGLIQDSVHKVEDGTRLVNQSGQTLQQIMVAVKKVSDIIAEISAASQEQSAGIHQVNKAISQMDQMTQQNSSLVEEAASSSESMREQAQKLKQHVAFFNIGSFMQDRPAPPKRHEKPVLVSKTEKRVAIRDKSTIKKNEWTDF